MKIGLVGYGKAGAAVANVLSSDPRYQLQWIAKRHQPNPGETHPGSTVPILGLDTLPFEQLFEQHPVEAIVDFSSAASVHLYGPSVAQRGIMVVSAISAYEPEDIAYMDSLGAHTRVLRSPNITLGINFLIMAARLLRSLAPFADVEVVEQHFREKPEVSGTARKIAESLELDDDRITSLRLGGIIGHHEVIFGFPYQTVRIIHDSIKREAFGTGAAFALEQLSHYGPGVYTFEDLLMRVIRAELLKEGRAAG